MSLGHARKCFSVSLCVARKMFFPFLCVERIAPQARNFFGVQVGGRGGGRGGIYLMDQDLGEKNHQYFGVTPDKLTTGFLYNSKSLSAVSPEG